MEPSPTFVFFRLSSPDDAHGLARRIEEICPAWTELQPEGEWVVGVDVAGHVEDLSLAVRAAAGWAAEAGLAGVPLEYDDEIFFVPAVGLPAQGPGAVTSRRPRARVRRRGRPLPQLPPARPSDGAAACRPSRPVARRRPWR